MIKLPQVVGLTLCERMTADVQTRQIGLAGLFQYLHSPQFPTGPHNFTVYGILFGGSGEGTLELTVFRTETEEVVHRYQRWLALADSQRHIDLEVRITRCVFPAVGRYLLLLSLDGEHLAQRILDVFPTRGRS